MPRINWNAIEREEQSIMDDDNLSYEQKRKAIAELHREARDEYREQQDRERRDDFGDW